MNLTELRDALALNPAYAEPLGDILDSVLFEMLEVQETDCVRLGELTTLLGRDVDDHECDECDGSGTILTWEMPEVVMGLLLRIARALEDWWLYDDLLGLMSGGGSAKDATDKALKIFTGVVKRGV